MSCTCGATCPDDCTTLAAELDELAALGALPERLRTATDFTEPTWKRMRDAAYCLLHPTECLHDAKARATNRIGLLVIAGYLLYRYREKF